MEYRKFPRGNEELSVLGLGMGGIHKNSGSELEAIFSKALVSGINFFDLCAGGKNVFAPFGKAIAGMRDKVFFQMHFGAVFNEDGEYSWTRDFETIKNTIEFEFDALKTDYADFGFLHCVDEELDLDELIGSGVFDLIKSMKSKGMIHHIGFSSHTPAVAEKILDMNIMDMMMFSINPAYDYEQGDEYGIGTVSERVKLFKRCASEEIGISVMKPFFAGKLLSADTSPFGSALTKYQCLQYALDRPGVLSTVPGIRSMTDLDELIGFASAAADEKDYSIIGSFKSKDIDGSCVYCNHCQPCPAGIDIGLVNKYYDLAQVGDKLAFGHYDKLSVKASACLSCGHCDDRCPFEVKQSERMHIIDEYFRNSVK